MNASEAESIPMEYSLSDSRRVNIVIQSVLVYIGVFCNVIALGILIRKWKTGSRVYFFIVSLCIADIIGIGVRGGIDIGWNTTYVWTAGEAACKICMFFYSFGNSLAHYFLVSFNVDNAVTVLTFNSSKILRVLMISVSVIAAICIQAPKAFIFSIQTHPSIPELVQCVSFGYFENQRSERAYNLIMGIAIYWFPLFLIMLTSVPTILTWFKTTGVDRDEKTEGEVNEMRTMSVDLAMVTTLNFVFFLCWTPAIVTHMFIIFGKVQFVSDTLTTVAQFISLSNSCINPIVYGIFACFRK